MLTLNRVREDLNEVADRIRNYLPLPDDKPTPVFPEGEMLTRDWGEEHILAKTEFYTLKKMVMYPGKAGGLQIHQKKDETGSVVEGSAVAEFDDGTGEIQTAEVGPGDTVRFPPGTVHRMTAGPKGITYYEASTPYLNDRVHKEAEYGIEKETGGLPSTTLNDIIRIPVGAGLPGNGGEIRADALFELDFLLRTLIAKWTKLTD